MHIFAAAKVRKGGCGQNFQEAGNWGDEDIYHVKWNLLWQDNGNDTSVPKHCSFLILQSRQALKYGRFEVCRNVWGVGFNAITRWVADKIKPNRQTLRGVYSYIENISNPTCSQRWAHRVAFDWWCSRWWIERLKICNCVYNKEGLKDRKVPLLQFLIFPC